MARSFSSTAAAFAIGSGLTAAPATAAFGEIKEYQIARMLNFRTECRMTALHERDPDAEGLRFFGECGNMISYPDGVEIVCPDPDDEWVCRILTGAKTYPHLDILKRRP